MYLGRLSLRKRWTSMLPMMTMTMTMMMMVHFETVKSGRGREKQTNSGREPTPRARPAHPLPPAHPPPRAQALPHLDRAPRPILRQARLHEPLERGRARARDVDGAQDVGDGEREAAGFVHDAELALGGEREGEGAVREALFEGGGIEEAGWGGWGRSRGWGGRVVGECEAEGGVVHREGDGCARRGRVLVDGGRKVRSGADRRGRRGEGKGTGNRAHDGDLVADDLDVGAAEVRRATRAARHAQSRRLPASARQWIVRRRCHTCERQRQRCACVDVDVYVYVGVCVSVCGRTRWPARTHSDSLSMVSLRRTTLSSMRASATSSSEGL